MTAGANVLTSRATPRRRDAPVDTIPAFGVRWLLDALERLGYDADALAEAAGLRRRDLTDPDGVVACTIYGAIIERAQATRFTANLGLQVAVQTPMGTYPLLDYLVLTSSDVDAGLRQLTRYFALVSNPLRIELAEDGPSLSVRLVGSAIPLIVEFTAALLVLHFRRETDGRFAPDRICFAHRPDDPSEFQRVLGGAVHCGASWSGVVVSESVRRIPLRRRDALLRSVLERQADEIVAKLPRERSAVIDVRRALESRIGRGGTGIDQIARHLASSPRTLQRRLASEGSSYQEVFQEWRKEAARRHLSESTLAVAEVAFLLDYSEPAAFHRAFKRWFGVTPQTFRRRNASTRPTND